MQDFHSLREIFLFESWSQYLVKLLPHRLGLKTFFISSRNTFNSFFFKMPSLSSSNCSNFHSATYKSIISREVNILCRQTSFFALPGIVPFGLPLAPNILACSVLTISMRLLLNAVLSACVQSLSRPFWPFFPFPLIFPLLNLPVTPRR